jgi:WXG100 family type VII secretion target
MDIGALYARISQMRDAAATLGRSAARVSECIEAVDTEIRALSAERYLSESAEEFRREYNRLTPHLRDAHDHLVRFQDRLNAAADEIEVAARPTG